MSCASTISSKCQRCECTDVVALCECFLQENLLVNLQFDELSAGGSKWLGETVSFGDMTNGDRGATRTRSHRTVADGILICRFPIAVKEILLSELTGLARERMCALYDVSDVCRAVGNMTKKVFHENVPQTVVVASAMADNESVVQCVCLPPLACVVTWRCTGGARCDARRRQRGCRGARTI